MNCGYCKDCEWRNKDRYCTNDTKIDEDCGQGRGDDDDKMIYSYRECGGFQVGDNFGCVHFTPLASNDIGVNNNEL